MRDPQKAESIYRQNKKNKERDSSNTDWKHKWENYTKDSLHDQLFFGPRHCTRQQLQPSIQHQHYRHQPQEQKGFH